MVAKIFEKYGVFKRVFEAKEIRDPKLLSALSNTLSLKILSLLSKKPMCPRDIARKLKENEQKIYYHIEKLERLGIIKVVKKERRVGAIAKIYSLRFPSVYFKVSSSPSLIVKEKKIESIELLKPFISSENDFLIVVGSPDPHGKYGAQASDGYAAIELSMFLGIFIQSFKIPSYKLDTQLSKEDLKKNLILIGGPKANIWIEKINKRLPIYFDKTREWIIVSSLSKRVYYEDDVGIVGVLKNPFNRNKWVMLAAGKRFKGTRAATISIIKYPDEILKGNRYNSEEKLRVVKGIDRRERWNSK